MTKYFTPRWGLRGSEFLKFEKDKWNFFGNHINDKNSIELKKNYFSPSSKYFSLDGNSYDGKLYMSAMNLLCNISTANRIHHGLVINDYLTKKMGLKNLQLINDNIHDSIKYEKMNNKMSYIHRHGAAPVNSSKNIIVLPSYAGGEVFLGKILNNSKTYFNSICHGTGRKYDRPIAKKKFHNKSAKKEIKKGIKNFYFSMKNLSGEHPKAFNTIDEILNILNKKFKIELICKTKPLFILKS